MPTNIWVGVGLMKPAQVTFPLAPVYEQAGIEFAQAAGREIDPEGDVNDSTPHVTAEALGRDVPRRAVPVDAAIWPSGVPAAPSRIGDMLNER